MENSEKVIDKELYNAAVRGDQSFLKTSHNEEEYFVRQTYQKNNYLHIAIRHKQSIFIKLALTIQSNIISKLLRQQNDDGNTPLHVAAEVGNMDIVNLLLNYKGAGEEDRDKLWRVKNNKGNTPLHVAILYRKFGVVTLLLSKVLDPQLTQDINKSMETPLHLVIKFQSVGDKKELVNIINLLDPNQLATVGEILRGKQLLPIIELLLQKDSSVACLRDENGLTPLLRAASLEAPYDLEVIKQILGHQPQSAEVCDHSGKTILHHLSRQLSYDEAKELLGYPETNSLLNYQDHDGNTPAHVAVRNNDFNLVRVLLGCSADFLTVNNEGVSAADLLEQNNGISKAFAEGISELTEEECQKVENLDEEFLKGRLVNEGREFLLSRAPDGRNILHLIVDSPILVGWNESQPVTSYVERILDMFPGLMCQTDGVGNTPVHKFASLIRLAPSLFDSLADLFDESSERAGFQSPWQMQNAFGNTPLHESVSSASYTTDLVTVFKIWRRDTTVINYKNKRDETPLHMLSNLIILGDKNPAHAHAMLELEELMAAPNIQVDGKDGDGLDPFMRAVQKSCTHLIRIYCQRHPYVVLYKLPDDGRTALHLAIEKGHFEHAKLYLAAAASFGAQSELLDCSDNKGVTPTDLISSVQHLSSTFEKFLWKEGLLVGKRSMYGVPMAKVEVYTTTIGVVAALLATVSFTAGFTVPGGNHDNGVPILMRRAAFQVFMVSNSLALCFSMMVLFCLLWIMTTQNKKESILLVDTSILLLELSFHSTVLTFMMGVYVTTVNTIPWIAILSCVLSSSVILFMHRWFIRDYLGPFCTRLIMWSTQIKNFLKAKVWKALIFLMIKVLGALEHLQDWAVMCCSLQCYLCSWLIELFKCRKDNVEGNP